MNKDDFFTSAPKMIAICGLLPLVLVLLALMWKVVTKSRTIEARWTLVEAVVVDADRRTTMTLEWPWKGTTKRQEVNQEGGRNTLSNGQKVLYYINPDNTTEVHRAGFADLWSGAIVLGVFSVLLTGVAVLMFWLGGSRMSDNPEAFFSQAAARPSPAPVEDRPGVIEMHEPSESWKANVFWGLLFGLLLIVPSFFAEAGTPGWKKYGSMLAGLAWTVFMGRCALQNRGRTVRCDDTSIFVLQPFGSYTIPLHEVRKITRDDVRKKFREIEEFGMSRREKLERMDTMAPIVLYVLYNAKDEELLRLDKNMQPPAEMQRFLRRMEKVTGKAIVVE